MSWVRGDRLQYHVEYIAHGPQFCTESCTSRCMNLRDGVKGTGLHRIVPATSAQALSLVHSVRDKRALPLHS